MIPLQRPDIFDQTPPLLPVIAGAWLTAQSILTFLRELLESPRR